MAFELNYRRLAEAAVAIVATASLFYFGNGLDPCWPLMWFAPLPVLMFALRNKWWAAALVSMTALLLGNLNTWSYFTKTLSAPQSAWLTIFAAAGAAFTAGVLLFRALVLRGAVWSGLMALSATWVTSEYARNVTSPHGSAGSLAYSQLNFLPFLQLASITGPWGMSFVLLLFPAAVAIALHLRQTSPIRALWVTGAVLGVLAIVLIYGAVRLAIPQAQTVRVGLVTSDEKGNATVTDPGADTERLFHDYATEARRLSAKGAQAIVMPEKLGVTLQGKTANTDALLQSVADEAQVTIVAGVVRVDAPLKFNEARIYIPGSPLQRYDKQHMLPPFESNLKPGTTLTVLPRPHEKWGVAICKDMDFDAPARLYGKAEIGLLLVPAWDFVVDGFWHGHIAVMRGVEDGFSIARAAKNGFLTVSDNRGRIVGEVASGSAPFPTLLVDVPVAHAWTIYQLLGDWFAWLAIALLVLALIKLTRLRGHATTSSGRTNLPSPAKGTS